MFARLFVKAYLFFIGLRFFETTVMPKTVALVNAEMTTVNGEKFAFRLFREEGEDRLHRFGRTKVRPFIGYILECRSEDDTVQNLFRCNRMNFVFKGEKYVTHTEKYISSTLMKLFVEHAKHTS